MSYPCPCCGYKTLTNSPPGSYSICPVCFWEDNGLLHQPGKYNDGSNRVSLREAQRNFLSLGACEPDWVGEVRSPTEAEARDPDWEPLDVQAERMRSELIDRISAAFASVKLEDGITIHQARALDDYEDQWKAREVDKTIPWQEIPDEWIEKFSDVFAFMDGKGLRHAIPAYMIWCLRYRRITDNSYWQTVDRVKKISDVDREIFTADQLQVIEEFHQFTEIFDEN